MKILLAQPAPFEPGRLGLENVIWLSEPVGLTSLAAMLPDHEVRVLDMRLEPDTEFNRVLQEFEPDLVGTTSMTTDCYQARALLHMAKSTLGEGVFTIVGGHHPTLSPGEFEHPCVDAMCIGEGEDTFRELIDHLDGGGDRRDLAHINGLRYLDADGVRQVTAKRAQTRDLDTFPAPARHLIEKYSEQYFFTVGNPMASMATSRGCSFDCNFCGIWEFYERKTRFMSAKAICDQMETCKEQTVFFIDDNFLTSKKRLNALADEIMRRGIKKWWGTQGRSDFIADNPDTMRKLRDAGMVMVLSGFESNEDNNLEHLKKRNTADKNRRAAKLLQDLGIVSTGIFMVRPDFSEQDFDDLYEHINNMGVAIPIITVLTPLPGTQLFRKEADNLLTKDARLFDLLHAVTPTKLSRKRFYEKLAESNAATWPSFEAGTWNAIKKRPKFFLTNLKGTLRFLQKVRNYSPIYNDYRSHLRDEIGIIDPDSRAVAQPARDDSLVDIAEPVIEPAMEPIIEQTEPILYAGETR